LLSSHHHAAPSLANPAINPKANSPAKLYTPGNIASCTSVHTKEPSPDYEPSIDIRKKSGFRVVLNKMFKPRNPAKPT
jgi:hypothetical protein